jgi:hypothetical protein
MNLQIRVSSYSHVKAQKNVSCVIFSVPLSVGLNITIISYKTAFSLVEA